MFLLTQHARQRMRERSITQEEIEDTLEHGSLYPTHCPNRTLAYHTHLHLYVVVDTSQQMIITVFESDYRKSYSYRRKQLTATGLRCHSPPQTYNNTPFRYEIIS